MNRLIPCLVASFVLVACSSPPVTQKTNVPPPTHAPPRPAVKTNPTNEEATQKWLRGEIERLTGRPPEQLLQGPTSQAAPPVVNPTDEVATEQWLQQPQQPVVYDRYVMRQQPVPYGYDVRGEPVFAYPAHHYHPYETPFPVNTVLGAGIGAIIGHQSHHQAQGAWIGGAIGFLADLGRWYR